MILLDRVSFSYPRTQKKIITDLTLSLAHQSWVAITGPDGAGKTTLAKLIAGLVQPDSGTVVATVPPAGSPPRIGYLGGDPYDSLVGMSVEEDVAFGLENMMLPRAEMRMRLEQALKWTGLESMEQRLTHTLSGGEQQKLALASLIALGARVLVVDEALAMLDRPARMSIRRIMGSLVENLGLTVIEVTQNMADALTAQRLIFMAQCGITFDGDPSAFLSSTNGREWTRMAGGVAGLMAALPCVGISLDCRTHRYNIIDELIDKIKDAMFNGKK